MNDEERRRKKERKKEKEQNRPDIDVYEVRFSDSVEFSGTLRVLLYLDSEVLLVYRLFALLLARLGARAPIPYVQDAILNLRHHYIVVATATTDNYYYILIFTRCSTKTLDADHAIFYTEHLVGK